jgi:hypothetical protein
MGHFGKGFGFVQMVLLCPCLWKGLGLVLPVQAGVGLRGACLSVCLWFWSFLVLASLAFSCCVSGLLALPLCGAALTFFAAAKKDKQRKRLTPPAHKRVPRTATVVVHLESVLSHIRRQ